MKRLLALSGLLLAATSTFAANDFPNFRDSFRAAFGLVGGTYEPTPADRQAAVEAVSTFGNEDSTRLLVLGIRLEHERIQALIDRREEVRTGRDRSLKGALPEPYLKMLKDQIDAELRVLETIEGALAKLTDDKAIKYLATDALRREKHWKAREVVAQALGRIGSRDHIKALVGGLSDKDPRVRTAVLLAFSRMRAEEALQDVISALADKEWMVRSAALEALGKILDPRAFEAILALLEKEEGTLAEECAEALKKITGQDFGRSVNGWRSWWADNKEKALAGNRAVLPEEPKELSEEDKRYYHGIPVKSTRPIFIIDISESMAYSTTEFTEKPGEGEDSRLDAAKRELTKAIDNLVPRTSFGLIAFHSVVMVWRPRLVPAKDAMKADAKAWSAELTPTGTTNIYGALEAAFRMSGMGITDKYYPPLSDTIYLLSDGAPTNQDLTNDDPERVLRAVREWNRLGRMKIHTIGLKGHSAAFMSALAQQNGGTYISRE